MKIKLLALKCIILISFSGLILSGLNQAKADCFEKYVPEKLSKQLATIEMPKPITRVPPIYPRDAARNSREGWARLSFVIDEQGDVSNVIVMETSGSADFAKASASAVKRWKYKPAFENGKPIQQCVNTVQMDFKMSTNGQNKVSRRFYSKYKKAKKALDDKDYQQVESLLASIGRHKKMHLSENNYYRLLSADYAKAEADQALELYHLNRVSFSGDLKEGTKKLAILNRLFMLEVQLYHFKRAHQLYQKLKKLDAAKDYMASYEAIMIKVDKIIQGEDDLLYFATVKDNGFWSHRLIRNDFSIIDVKGSLNSLDVRCANKRHVFTIGEKATWQVPKAWQDCSLYIRGDVDTLFTLVEFPFANNSI